MTILETDRLRLRPLTCDRPKPMATLFDRPTRQNGPHGLADWIRMFDTAPFAGVDPALAGAIIAETEDALRPVLWQGDAWYVDYVRIRFKLRKL